MGDGQENACSLPEEPLPEEPLPEESMCLEPTTRALDELTPIAEYIAHEMNTNARSPQARQIRELNAYDSMECIASYTSLPWWRQFLDSNGLERCIDQQLSTKVAAVASWTLLVRQGAIWDHKERIRTMFTPAVGPGEEQAWHRYYSTLYYYDIWSNIHYGYVGMACGFTADGLLDGAGLEQIGSDLTRRQLPRLSAGVSGMRRFDDSSDRAAIRIGIALYPAEATSAKLVSEVVGNLEVSSKPYVP